MVEAWVHVAAIFGSSCSAAVVVVWYLRSYQQRRLLPSRLVADVPGPCIFLFDRTELIDASDGARALLAASPVEGDDWLRFLGFAASRFPGLEEKLARLAETGRFTLTATARHPMTLRAEWLNGITRIALSEGEHEPATPLPDGITQHAMEDEIEALRNTLDRAPFPAWREDGADAVTWANRAYVELSSRLRPSGEAMIWPLPRLFTEPVLGQRSLPPGRQRLSLVIPGTADPRWFDVHCYPDGGDRVLYALPADAAVQAEQALRSFVQTLTKTFAHLTIGLAIFDRKRQLALFNPALIDLTGLPPEFLSSRPTLFRMLDAMRERQTLPEPSDYKSWRNEVAALERAAATGQYEETWSLANGQTYRVTGRPHPDGALAFVIEDISDETALARRFHSDLGLSHSVLDTLGEAIAVFAPSGVMTLSNAAYSRLWHDGAETAHDANIADAARTWQNRSAVTPVWGEMRGLVLETGAGKPWSGEARLSDGRLLNCRFAPLPGGASMVGFAVTPAARRPGVVVAAQQTA